MSFPQHSSPPPTTFAAAQRQRRVRTARRVLLLAVAGLFAAWQTPLEIGRWQFAAALNARSQGQKEAAYDELDGAIARFPANPALYLQRAEWRFEDRQVDQAIVDCDRMLEVGEPRYPWLMVHSQFLWNAGQFKRAVEDWKAIEQFSQRSGRPNRHTALNGLAYAQSLAGEELDDALKNANEAINLLPAESNNERLSRDELRDLLEARAAVLDTRGYLHYLEKSYEPALADMNAALSYLAAALELAKKDGRSIPPSPKEFAKFADSYPKTLQSNGARQVAVMHHHRALVLDALGRQQEAQRDKAVVRRLIGRDGDETLF